MNSQKLSSQQIRSLARHIPRLFEAMQCSDTLRQIADWQGEDRENVLHLSKLFDCFLTECSGARPYNTRLGQH